MAPQPPLSSFKSYNEDDGRYTETRDISPSHYVLKIECFSLVVKNGMEKYESSEFETGKYKWRLIIDYPNGDPSKKGERYLSLFLRLVPDPKSPRGGEVNAIVKFFLYDHNSDTYHTARGRARRFHAPNPEWGIPKFLSQNDFEDSSNGYLVDDACIFGAEVFVVENSGKRECLRLQERSTTKQDWTIPEFSNIRALMYPLPQFYVGDYAWTIWLFPRGDGKGKDQSISLFLYMSNSNILNPDQKVLVEFAISVKLGDPPTRRQASHLFSAESKNWGWPLFLPLQTIQDKMINNSFTIEAEVSILGEVDKLL